MCVEWEGPGRRAHSFFWPLVLAALQPFTPSHTPHSLPQFTLEEVLVEPAENEVSSISTDAVQGRRRLQDARRRLQGDASPPSCDPSALSAPQFASCVCALSPYCNSAVTGWVPGSLISDLYATSNDALATLAFTGDNGIYDAVVAENTKLCMKQTTSTYVFSELASSPLNNNVGGALPWSAHASDAHSIIKSLSYCENTLEMSYLYYSWLKDFCGADTSCTAATFLEALTECSVVSSYDPIARMWPVNAVSTAPSCSLATRAKLQTMRTHLAAVGLSAGLPVCRTPAYAAPATKGKSCLLYGEQVATPSSAPTVWSTFSTSASAAITPTTSAAASRTAAMTAARTPASTPAPPPDGLLQVHLALVGGSAVSAQSFSVLSAIRAAVVATSNVDAENVRITQVCETTFAWCQAISGRRLQAGLPELAPGQSYHWVYTIAITVNASDVPAAAATLAAAFAPAALADTSSPLFQALTAFASATGSTVEDQIAAVGAFLATNDVVSAATQTPSLTQTGTASQTQSGAQTGTPSSTAALTSSSTAASTGTSSRTPSRSCSPSTS